MHWTSFPNKADQAFCAIVCQTPILLSPYKTYIYSFATGAWQMPPIGFEFRLTNEFRSMPPLASTCANTLELPITETNEEFEATMCFVRGNVEAYNRAIHRKATKFPIHNDKLLPEVEESSG